MIILQLDETENTYFKSKYFTHFYYVSCIISWNVYFELHKIWFSTWDWYHNKTTLNLNINFSKTFLLLLFGRKKSPRRGIEPRSPAWQAGILTTILSRIRCLLLRIWEIHFPYFLLPCACKAKQHVYTTRFIQNKNKYLGISAIYMVYENWLISDEY